MSPRRPGWRRELSKMRDASPPTALGSTWPAVYDTKYARLHHAKLSCTPRAASSRCQRKAIGGTPAIMIAIAPKNHPRWQCTTMSMVLRTSSCQRM